MELMSKWSFKCIHLSIALVLICLHYNYTYGFRYANIGDLSEQDSQRKVNVLCSVASKKLVNFGVNKSATLLQGVLEDNSGTITYVAWHEHATNVKPKLTFGGTYVLENVAVTKCKPQYTLTSKNVQLILDSSTVVNKQDGVVKFHCPLDLVKIKMSMIIVTVALNSLWWAQ